MNDIAKNIGDVLAGIVRFAESRQVESYRRFPHEIIEGADRAARAGEAEDFHRLAVRPLNDVLEGLLIAETPEASPRLRFLLHHYDFVEKQVLALVTEMDGHAYSADRCRTILRALAGFLKDGRRIEFDYAQQYTYHLPRKALASHEEVLDFFDAIYELFYGRRDRFLRYFQPSAPQEN